MDRAIKNMKKEKDTNDSCAEVSGKPHCESTGACIGQPPDRGADLLPDSRHVESERISGSCASTVQESKTEYKFQYLHPSFYRCLTCFTAFNAPSDLLDHILKHVDAETSRIITFTTYPLKSEVSYNIEQYVKQLKQLSTEFSVKVNAHLLLHLSRDFCRLSVIFSGDEETRVSFYLIHHAVVVTDTGNVGFSDLLQENMLLPVKSQSDLDILNYSCTFHPLLDGNGLQCDICQTTFDAPASMPVAVHVCRHLSATPEKSRFVANCIVNFLRKLKEVPLGDAQTIKGRVEIQFAKQYRGSSVCTTFEKLGKGMNSVKITSFVSEVLLRIERGQDEHLETNENNENLTSYFLHTTNPTELQPQQKTAVNPTRQDNLKENLTAEQTTLQALRTKLQKDQSLFGRSANSCEKLVASNIISPLQPTVAPLNQMISGFSTTQCNVSTLSTFASGNQTNSSSAASVGQTVCPVSYSSTGLSDKSVLGGVPASITTKAATFVSSTTTSSATFTTSIGNSSTASGVNFSREIPTSALLANRSTEAIPVLPNHNSNCHKLYNNKPNNQSTTTTASTTVVASNLSFYRGTSNTVGIQGVCNESSDLVTNGVNSYESGVRSTCGVSTYSTLSGQPFRTQVPSQIPANSVLYAIPSQTSASIFARGNPPGASSYLSAPVNPPSCCKSSTVVFQNQPVIRTSPVWQCKQPISSVSVYASASQSTSTSSSTAPTPCLLSDALSLPVSVLANSGVVGVPVPVIATYPNNSSGQSRSCSSGSSTVISAGQSVIGTLPSFIPLVQPISGVMSTKATTRTSSDRPSSVSTNSIGLSSTMRSTFSQAKTITSKGQSQMNVKNTIPIAQKNLKGTVSLIKCTNSGSFVTNNSPSLTTIPPCTTVRGGNHGTSLKNSSTMSIVCDANHSSNTNVISSIANKQTASETIPRDKDIMMKDYSSLNKFSKSGACEWKILQTGFYRCGKIRCRNAYLEAKDLIMHIMNAHGKDSNFTCYLCRDTYRTGIQLSTHFDERHIHSTDKTPRTVAFMCNAGDCPFWTSNLESYIAHYGSIHQALTTFHCQQCSKKFSSSHLLYCHLLVSFTNIYLCNLCPAKSFSRPEISSHISNCHTGALHASVKVSSYLSCKKGPRNSTSPIYKFATIDTRTQNAPQSLSKNTPPTFKPGVGNVGKSIQNRQLVSPIQKQTSASPGVGADAKKDGSNVDIKKDNRGVQIIPSTDTSGINGANTVTDAQPQTSNDQLSKTLTSHQTAEVEKCLLGSGLLSMELMRFMTVSPQGLKCTTCDFLPRGKEHLLFLQTHILRHLNMNIHKCHLCVFSCTACNALEKHFLSVHRVKMKETHVNRLYKNIEEFKQALMKIKLGNERSLPKNSKTLSRSRPPVLDKWDRSTTASPPNETKSRSSHPFMCSICKDYRSDRQERVFLHITLKHQDTRFQCQKCSYHAATQRVIEEHCNSEHGDQMSYYYSSPFPYISQDTIDIPNESQNFQKQTESTLKVSQGDIKSELIKLMLETLKHKENIPPERKQNLMDKLSSIGFGSNASVSDPTSGTATKTMALSDQSKSGTHASPGDTEAASHSTNELHHLVEPSAALPAKSLVQYLQCKQCVHNNRFKTLTDIDNHICTNHAGSKLNCTKCGNIVYSSFTDLVCVYSDNLHDNTLFNWLLAPQGAETTPSDGWRCGVCLMKCDTFLSLHYHIVKIHNKLGAICSVCPKHRCQAFPTMHDLCVHLDEYHKNEIPSYSVVLPSKPLSTSSTLPESSTLPGQENINAAYADESTKSSSLPDFEKITKCLESKLENRSPKTNQPKFCNLKCPMCCTDYPDLNTLDQHIEECHAHVKVICGHCSDSRNFTSVTSLFINHHVKCHEEQQLAYMLVDSSVTKSKGNGGIRYSHLRRRRKTTGRRRCSARSYSKYFGSSGSEDNTDDGSEDSRIISDFSIDNSFDEEENIGDRSSPANDVCSVDTRRPTRNYSTPFNHSMYKYYSSSESDENSETDTTDESYGKSAGSGSNIHSDHSQRKCGVSTRRRKRSNVRRSKVKWRCMQCCFKCNTLALLREHIRERHNVSSSQSDAENKEPSTNRLSDSVDDEVSGTYVFVNMAWRKKELEDNSLCYTCHLCPFETHFVLDFELHISLHQEFVKSIGCAVDDVRATKAKLKPRGRIILDDSDTEQSIISGKSESRSTPALKYSSESEHGDDPVEVIAISGSESQPSPASDKNEVNTSTSANIGSDATQVTATRDDENGVRLGNCANTHQNEKNCVRPRKQTDKRPDTRYHCPYCPFSSLLCDFLDHITKQHKESENEFVIACSKTAKTKKRAVVGVRDFMKAPLKNYLGDFLKLHGIKKLRTSSTDSIIIVPSTDIVPLSGQTEDILTPGSIVTSDENESLTRKRPLSTDEGDDYSRKRICVKNEASPADLCMTWVFEHDDCNDETSLDDVIVKVHFNNESYFADCLRQCEVNHSNGSHSDVKHILSDAAISDVDDGSVEDVADQMYVTDSDDGSSSDDEEKAKMAAHFSDIVQYINPSNC